MRFRVSSIMSCDFIWKPVSMSMEAKKFFVVESFTEADWQGSHQAKPTSASCHFMNGNFYGCSLCGVMSQRSELHL